MKIWRRADEAWPGNRIGGKELSELDQPLRNSPHSDLIPRMLCCRMSLPHEPSPGEVCFLEQQQLCILGHYWEHWLFWLLSWVCDPQSCELILESFKPLHLCWFLTQPRKTNTLRWTIIPKCPCFTAEKTKAQHSWLSCSASSFWWQGRDLNWILLSSWSTACHSVTCI